MTMNDLETASILMQLASLEQQDVNIDPLKKVFRENLDVSFDQANKLIEEYSR